MAKKVFLNVLYNIGIFICLITGYWGLTNSRYEFLAAALLGGAILVMLKIKLMKEIRRTLKP